MEINCTLLVQCLNFGIAYVILSRLIFKPVLEAIFEERAKREAVQHAITASQQAIKDLETKKSIAWQDAQHQFRDSLKQIPHKDHVAPFNYEYQYESASDAQVDAHARRIHDAIMKRVSDDFN